MVSPDRLRQNTFLLPLRKILTGYFVQLHRKQSCLCFSLARATAIFANKSLSSMAQQPLPYGIPLPISLGKTGTGQTFVTDLRSLGSIIIEKGLPQERQALLCSIVNSLLSSTLRLKIIPIGEKHIFGSNPEIFKHLPYGINSDRLSVMSYAVHTMRSLQTEAHKRNASNNTCHTPIIALISDLESLIDADNSVLRKLKKTAESSAKTGIYLIAATRHTETAYLPEGIGNSFNTKIIYYSTRVGCNKRLYTNSGLQTGNMLLFRNTEKTVLLDCSTTF